MNTLQRARKSVFHANLEWYLSISYLKLSTKLTKCFIKFNWRILFHISILLALNCASLVRINPSFVEHLVFLFFHLFDNWCNSVLSNLVSKHLVFLFFHPFDNWYNSVLSNLLSEFSGILRQQQVDNSYQLFSCPKKAWKESNYRRWAWQNQSNFIQSVIMVETQLSEIFRGLSNAWPSQYRCLALPLITKCPTAIKLMKRQRMFSPFVLYLLKYDNENGLLLLQETGFFFFPSKKIY